MSSNFIVDLIQILVRNSANSLKIKGDCEPEFKIGPKTTSLGQIATSSQKIETSCKALLNPAALEQLLNDGQLRYALGIKGSEYVAFDVKLVDEKKYEIEIYPINVEEFRIRSDRYPTTSR